MSADGALRLPQAAWRVMARMGDNGK